MFSCVIYIKKRPPEGVLLPKLLGECKFFSGYVVEAVSGCVNGAVIDIGAPVDIGVVNWKPSNGRSSKKFICRTRARAA